MPSSSKVLKFRSSDMKIFEVEEEIAVRMETIKQMVEDGCAEGEIPVPNVNGKILSMVIEWCRKHADKELKEEELESWTSKFMDVNTKLLHDLLMASNYLHVIDLLESCCRKAADFIKGRTPEQIRTTFGIKNDFTPEEEKQFRKQNAWAFN